MGQQPQQNHDLMKGTVEMMVLGVLSGDDLHGLEIYDEIARRSGGVLSVAEGSLYPALKRLELEGMITSEWRPSRNNRRARYYRLTDAGRRQLDAKRKLWAEFVDAVTGVLSGPSKLSDSAYLDGRVSPCAS